VVGRSKLWCSPAELLSVAACIDGHKAQVLPSFGSQRIGTPVTMPATDIARRRTGRLVPNACLLGGLTALTGVVSIAALNGALWERVAGTVVEDNLAAARTAYDQAKGPCAQGSVAPTRAPANALDW
jgi:pyruvate ferredoxin oxidoreductase gamma subunit